MKLFVFCFLTLMLLSSCGQKSANRDIVTSKVISNDIIAEVNDEPIKSYELEQAVSQQVFDELTRIYKIKSVALDYLIDKKIIEQEAKKKNVSISDYLDNYYEFMISKSNIDSLSSSLGLNNLSVIKGTTMVDLDKNSCEGGIELKTRLESIFKSQLLDSLKNESIAINRYIYPPRSPKLDLSNLPVYYRGNPHSKVSMVIISDYDCYRCIQSHDKFNEIYDKYKDKVKFGSLNFSSVPTFASLAADAAFKQGKYWEFSDSLYVNNSTIDSLSVYRIARNLNLDIIRFDQDLHSKITLDKLNNIINDLVNKGLFATPTIVINGRLIFDSNSIKEITYLLDKELE